MKTQNISFRFLSILFLLFFIGKNLQAQVDKTTPTDGMNNQKMDTIFKSEVDEIDGTLGNWQMLYGESVLLVLTDEKK